MTRARRRFWLWLFGTGAVVTGVCAIGDAWVGWNGRAAGMVIMSGLAAWGFLDALAQEPR